MRENLLDALRASQMRPEPTASVSSSNRPGQETRRVWAILCLGLKNFCRIDGAHWAGAFAFNAFFSLFPLILLLVTMVSFLWTGTGPGKR